MQEAARRKQTWKIPRRIQVLLTEAEAEQTGIHTAPVAPTAQELTNWRFVAPYSAAIDTVNMSTNLHVLESTVRHAHHGPASNARTTVVHCKRRTTELLFTGNIKNPRIE